MYGAGCTQTCHCISGCNKAKGCPADSTCEEGWSGTYCNRPDTCPSGMYGDLCNYNCHCKDNAACNKDTGVCPNGQCAPGWRGDDCQDGCPDGMYGAGCTQTCHCTSGCKKTTGCPAVSTCKSGWTGPYCNYNARLDITFFNLFAEPTSSNTNPVIGGYSGGDDVTSVGNSFTYGRVIDTGTGTDLPDSSSQVNTYTFTRRLYLGDGNERPGVYYCEATTDTGETEILHTVVIRSDAEIKPERHTTTVSWGEPVTLSMTTDIQHSSLKWKHNGHDISEWNGRNSITITYAVTNDRGVYECYSSESQRRNGKHGILRLIVSACPNGKYGENCQLSCPTCYNGGVCNATIGECICPPGFKGDNCQTACGKGNWGAVCDRKCSSTNNDACRGTMLCIAEPYGCSCSTSYTGLDCKDDCSTGMYGAGCTQTCHCTSGCNAATGCPAGSTCKSGWSGTYCNIPDNCPDGMYGDLCNYNCHCKDNAACNRSTGACSSTGCAQGWTSAINNECQGKLIPNIVGFMNVKVNPDEKTYFICKSYGIREPESNEIQIQLSGSSSWLPANDIQEESSYVYAANFTGVTVNVNDRYTCMLQLSPFNTVIKTIVVSVYELPRFASTNTPTVTVEATNATITWQKWIESTDIGDGPVEAYNVYYEQSGENNNWTMHHNIVVQDPSKTSYSTTITGLQWSTSYDFTVTVKRPGPKGEGSKDTFTTNITLCGVPDHGPILRNATSSQPRIIRIDIEVRCHNLQRSNVIMTGKMATLTGLTSGIGRKIVEMIMSRPAKGMARRDP
ncbi:uncharacterized protein LOC144436819 [Glandiceps talaboti]